MFLNSDSHVFRTVIQQSASEDSFHEPKTSTFRVDRKHSLAMKSWISIHRTLG